MDSLLLLLNVYLALSVGFVVAHLAGHLVGLCRAPHEAHSWGYWVGYYLIIILGCLFWVLACVRLFYVSGRSSK